MLQLTPVIVGLALIDSINPSAIAMTIYLLLSRTRYRAAVTAYLVGVFGTYLAVGVVLLFGLTLIPGDWRNWWYSPWAYAIEGCIGAALLVYSFAAPTEKSPGRRHSHVAAAGTAGLTLLGAGISLVELSTALPYLAAIALVVRMDLGWGSVWLLVLYNVVMNIPPVLLVIAYRISATRHRGWFERWQTRLSKGNRTTWLWTAGILGALLLADAVWYGISSPLNLVPWSPLR